MPTAEITYEALHQAFAEILVEYGPDHVYDREANNGICVYVNAEGDPQCLVGVALVKLGVEPGYLYAKFRPSSLGLPWENYDIPEALTIAQISQDNGSTWGEAIDRFEKYFTADKETYLMRDYDDMLDAAMHDHFEDQGDAIDRAMDTKAEQDMLADLEHDDPEADAADAADAEAARWAQVYTPTPDPEDVELAYDSDDYKGKHALGWTND